VKTQHTRTLFAAALVGVLAFTTTVALAETSRFDDLANAAFTENRPTKKTAPTEAYYDKSWRLLDIERVKW
jgi:hypothetical protein